METKAREILNKYGKDVYLIRKDGTKEKRRLGITASDCILVMRRGSKRKGNYLSSYVHDENPVIDIVPIIHKVSEEEQWNKQVNRAIIILERSGLWADVLNRFKLAREIGLPKIKEIYDIYWARDKDKSYDENQEIALQKIKAIDNRLISKNDEARNMSILMSSGI